jgi:hypothetical protein
LNEGINPGAIEICNGVDDNCNNLVDDDCVNDFTYTFDLSLDSVEDMRVLAKFKIKAKIKNNLNTPVSDVTVRLTVPNKFLVDKSAMVLGTLGANEEMEIFFNVIIEDYTESKAVFKLSVELPDSNKVEKEIPVNIVIPDFLIAPMPSFTQNTKENKICYDLYYVISNNAIDSADIELDILNPASVFGKSQVVDYMSSIPVKEGVMIKPLISNPYCLPSEKQYEVKGYLYKSSPWKLVDLVDESTEKINTE